MRRALSLAERGWGRVAPNPLVGAVVVREGRVVGEGWHTEFGKAHAEVEALHAAGEAARGATLYVSLEPCCHRGKTPPCTDAILAAGVRRVVFAASDPNPHAAGGVQLLGDAGVAVEGSVEEQAARDLNVPFFHRFSAAGASRPWLELKLALSLDGRMADAGGCSRWITGPESRAEVHRLRAGHDAIAVGIGTVLADDPLLTVRGPIQPRIPPTRIVFDRTLRTPPDGRLMRTASELPVWIVAGPNSSHERAARLEALGAKILSAPSLRDALRALRNAEIDSVFCEGGPRFAAALLQGGWVDRLDLFIAPLFLGGGPAPFAKLPPVELVTAMRWRRVRAAGYGPDTLITLERLPACSPG